MLEEEQQYEICSAIAERFDVPMKKLVPQATMESLNLDSLSMIEFLFEMEDKLGISLSGSRKPLKSLGEVFNEIDKALQVKAAGAAR